MLPEVEPAVVELIRDLVRKIADQKVPDEMFIGEAGDEFIRNSEQAATLFRSFGGLQRIELIARRDLPQGGRNVEYRVSFDERQIILWLELTAENRIRSMDLRR